MEEAELVNKVRKYLNKYFYTELEVWSTDNKKRIDMIVIHKSDTQNKYPIGIEFKKEPGQTREKI